jgi:hypothetical protein
VDVGFGVAEIEAVCEGVKTGDGVIVGEGKGEDCKTPNLTTPIITNATMQQMTKRMAKLLVLPDLMFELLISNSLPFGVFGVDMCDTSDIKEILQI